MGPPDEREHGWMKRLRSDASDGIPGWLRRVWLFFSRDVWQSDLGQLSRVTRLVHRTARVIFLAARGCVNDKCLVRASALTYITVLSLVPLLAFAFSVAKGFGLYHRLLQTTIQPFVDKTFDVDEAPQMHAAIMRVLEFVNTTNVSKLGIPGLVILAFTVIKLLSTIERSFNDIWGVQRSRGVLRKLADYLTMVTVTPIFLVAATALTIAAQASSAVEYLRTAWHLGDVIDEALRVLPLVAMWAGFTFVYMAMPNSKTRVSSAALGGLVAAILWELALVLHIKFQVGIARYNALYSSFAAFPIFLIWINVSWVTVLFGAEVCVAHQSEESYVHIARSRPADHAFKEVVALRAMARIGARFLAGGEAWTASLLATDLGVPQRPLQEILYLLASRGFLVDTPRGDEDGFVPARDLGAMRVKEILDVLKGTVGPVDVPRRTAVDEQIDRLMDGLERELGDSPNNVTMRQLAEAALREPNAGRDAQADAHASELATHTT
jgi:membrane protein